MHYIVVHFYDVVAWLRQTGKEYQTRLNQVLRQAMLEDIKKSA